MHFLNVGMGVSLNIRELAAAVSISTGVYVPIWWDSSKLDGAPNKQLGVSRLAGMRQRARIPFFEGLESIVAIFYL